jgi:hypothetical protein
MTWYDEAFQIIATADASAPAGLPLAQRRKLVNAVRPSHFVVTSWGRKTWGKAKRDYFAAFEDKPAEVIITDFGPSPLERARQRALRT